ncbi:MAG: hypothetical protein ACPHL6_08145, partial [Rubripirellula sp.]
SNQPTDMLEALRAAEGLANPRRSSQVGDLNDVQVADAKPAELYIYSDGCFPDLKEFDLGNLSPNFISVGTQQVKNLAITDFSTQRNVDATNRVQVFAKVMNLGTVKGASEVELKMNGELVDAALVSLEPGEEQGLAFELVSDQFAALTLTLDQEDDLLLDNRAFAGLTPSRRASVLVVTEGNTALRVGLETERISEMCEVTFVEPSYLATEAYAKRSLEGIDDLVVFDRCRPKQMPNSSTFFIGAIPPAGKIPSGEDADQGVPEAILDAPVASPDDSSSDPKNQTDSGGAGRFWEWAGDSSQLSIIDVDRTHPILRYLDLYALLVFDGRPLQLPAGARELITADIGTVMGVSDRDGYQDVVLGFPILNKTDEGGIVANTNWYAERSWPVFLLNLLRTVANASESTSALSYRPGDLVRGTLATRYDQVTVRTTSGRMVETVLRDQLRYETIDTEELGCYDVTSEGTLLERFSVNLFQRAESSIQAKTDLELGYQRVNAGNVDLVIRREYWRFVLVLVLLVMLVEWWIYNRRLA